MERRNEMKCSDAFTTGQSSQQSITYEVCNVPKLRYSNPRRQGGGICAWPPPNFAVARGSQPTNQNLIPILNRSHAELSATNQHCQKMRTYHLASLGETLSYRVDVRKTPAREHQGHPPRTRQDRNAAVEYHVPSVGTSRIDIIREIIAS